MKYTKWEIQTNLNNTIDLRLLLSNEKYNKYEKQWLVPKISHYDKLMMTHTKLILIFATIWIVFIILIGTGMKYSIVNAEGNELTIQDKIRMDRLKVCEKAYKDSWIGKQFIQEQVPSVRCANFMTLIYAYESDFGKSHKCTDHFNCHGMKWNWVDHPAWFIDFENEKEGREWFANRYFKFHYKKDIETFVNDWSETDIENYIYFVESKYSKIYSEIENLYFTS